MKINLCPGTLLLLLFLLLIILPLIILLLLLLIILLTFLLFLLLHPWLVRLRFLTGAAQGMHGQPSSAQTSAVRL